MISKAFLIRLGIFGILSGNMLSATRTWPQQPARLWNDSAAVWESSPGVPSTSPGIDDFAYILSSNEVTINSPEVIRRLYIDRTYTGYPPAASTVTVVSGGRLSIDSICQFGVDTTGAVLNIEGGQVIAAGTDRAGTWSVRLDSGASATVNISAGLFYIGGASQVLSLAGSSTVFNVSGTGSLELGPGSALVLDEGNSKIRLSEGGMITYHGVNAAAAVSALAAAGKIEGFLPNNPPPYLPSGKANGVGWYHDGQNTYVFADPQVTTDEVTFVVSHPQAVEDVTLRQSDLTYREDDYWTSWNFGKSQMLDVGYTTAVWNQYHAVTLIRFDMRGIPCQTVSSAKVRIYKPMNVTQITSQVPISIYSVYPANKNWTEGSKESQYQYTSASWKGPGSSASWASGASGCAAAGVDHQVEPLDSAIGIREVGQWLEFDIPAALVQDWLENPQDNAGLIIKSPDNVERGEHVVFYASEHESGKGPRLILNGTPGPIRVPFDEGKPYNPRYVLPPQGTKFDEYLDEVNSRYTKWTLDPSMKLNASQRIYPYYWDIIVDGEVVVPGGYMPIADMLPGLDALIQNNDVTELRKFHEARQRYHHVWEYIKEQRWYESGDVIEVLSPYQAGLLWCRNDEEISGWNGILTSLMENYPYLSEADIDARVAGEVALVESQLELTPAQAAIISPVIAQEERTRCEYFNKCKLAIGEVQQLIEQKNNGSEMIDALSRAMVNHDIFLYHDSFFGGTRWSVIMDNADMVKYTEWWIDSKYDEFSPSRISNRWDDVLEYWPETWPSPTLDFYIPETCPDTHAYGFSLPMDISGVYEGQPDCYINIYDLAFFAQHWMMCNDPQNPDCLWPF